MPPASRMQDSVNTGHGCSTITTILEGSSNVIIEGLGAAYQGAALTPHTITNPAPLPAPPCIPHTAKVNVGSSTVKVNGKPLARIGDSADAGSIISGAKKVIAK
jgi:uncharacterized Zn-binding protein involved in type VI secretion